MKPSFIDVCLSMDPPDQAYLKVKKNERKRKEEVDAPFEFYDAWQTGTYERSTTVIQGSDGEVRFTHICSTCFQLGKK